jgi:hypothetical protein
MPNRKKCMLSDFIVIDDFVSISPSAGVRQFYALSTTVFNLAAEPLLRSALSESNNPGIDFFGQIFKATAYIDDILVSRTSRDTSSPITRSCEIGT